MCLTTAKSRAKFWPVNAHKASSGLGCCPFLSGSNLHLSPPVALAAVRSKAVVLLLLTFCLVLPTLCDSVIVLCFVVSYFMSILVWQSS